MRHLVLLFCLAVSAPMAQAQETTPEPDTELFEGFEEFAEGMRELLEGFQQDVTPLMEDLGEQLRGLGAYHPPEILPNGDIIIRRKTPQELSPDEEIAPNADGSIDL